MLTTISAGRYSVRGVSVGGIYTSLHVPELNALFDVGIALRNSAAADHIFLSHAHADHIGALVSLLGIRGLLHKPPPRLYMPAAIVATVEEALATMTKLQRYDLAVHAVGMEAGDEQPAHGDVIVRALPTFHPVPSLGYQLLRRVNKLKPGYHGLPGDEIGRRRRAGEDLFYQQEHLEFAYVTDTLISALDHTPSLLKSRVLVLECSFLDARKSLKDSRAGCHIHLDEIVERQDSFENAHLVLMHFSQIYKPRDVRRLLEERIKPNLLKRIIPFLPNQHL